MGNLRFRPCEHDLGRHVMQKLWFNLKRVSYPDVGASVINYKVTIVCFPSRNLLNTRNVRTR